MQAWPAESTKRSRSGQDGSVGSWRITSRYSRYATGASAIAVPGCPEFAFWTASMARVRIVSIARSWIGFNGLPFRTRGAPRLAGSGDGRALRREQAVERCSGHLQLVRRRLARAEEALELVPGAGEDACGRVSGVAVHPGEGLDGDADGGQRGRGARGALVA